MAKKKLQPTAPVLTRGQMSRAERERRQIRNLNTAVIAVLSVVALIVLVAAIQSFVLRPNETVASVNNVNINRGTYQKLRRYDVFQQEQQNLLLAQAGQTTVDTTQPSQVSTIDNETTLDSNTVQQLIDAEVERQYAKSDVAVNIVASIDDLRAEARKSYIPTATPPVTPEPSATAAPPTAAGGISGRPTLTPTMTMTFTPGPPTKTPTVTATLPPVPGAEETAVATYNQIIKSLSQSTGTHAGDPICSQGCPNISEEDYLHLIVEPQYLQTQIGIKLVPTDTEQIHAQHILTDTADGATKILDMLNKHGADPDSKYFTELANTQSSEQLKNIANGQAPNGGDLGWFPKNYSGFDQDFVNGAWTVKAGEYTTAPVKTSFGYHIIKVLDREQNRPIATDKLATARSQAYSDWLDAKKQVATIHSNVALPTPVPTQPAVTEPTQAPAVTTPASVTGTTTLPNTTPAGTTPAATSPSGSAPSNSNLAGNAAAPTATSPPK